MNVLSPKTCFTKSRKWKTLAKVKYYTGANKIIGIRTYQTIIRSVVSQTHAISTTVVQPSKGNVDVFKKNVVSFYNVASKTPDPQFNFGILNFPGSLTTIRNASFKEK